MNKKALIIVTSHNQLGETGKKTGYYLPEVTHPYFAMTAKGIEVDIASPKGGKAPLDQSSLDLTDPQNKLFMETELTKAKIENTLAIDDVDSSFYSAIFFAGGHGTMWDFPNNEKLSKIAAEIYEKGGVVAAVCHGPAALVNIKLSNGKYLIEGKNISAFSNDEEHAAGLTEIMPFLLETTLVERGANYSKAALWKKHVIISDRLITGQNPASGYGVGEALANII